MMGIYGMKMAVTVIAMSSHCTRVSKIRPHTAHIRVGMADMSPIAGKSAMTET